MMKCVNVLLVEDDPGDVFLIREAMKNSSLDFDVHVADNGEKALDYLYRRTTFVAVERPDLIMLDLNLPRINGLEVLREIKSVPELSSIPVIVLTTSKNEADASMCRTLGASEFLSKPPSFEEFLEIGKQLERFWLGRARPAGE